MEMIGKLKFSMPVIGEAKDNKGAESTTSDMAGGMEIPDTWTSKKLCTNF